MSSRPWTTVVALLTTLVAVLTTAAPALVQPAAAADGGRVSVTISSLDPTVLSPGTDVAMTGTVTNGDDHAWTKVQAYLVIPPSPFTTRAQVEQAIADGDSYTGSRVIDVGTFDEVGDLAAGQSSAFSLSVPYEKLGLTGAQGVYPVGVQILATDDQGNRSPTAIARATTFLPMISDQQAAVPASVVWPFLMPDHRDASGDYTDPAGLAAAVGPGGRLRNVLDLAASTPTDAATVLIDPALLVGVDDLARNRHQPDDIEVTDAQRAQAGQFLTDLLSFARARTVWVLDYDRPDLLALSDNPDLGSSLRTAVDRATDSTLAAYQLSGRRVSWPTRGGVTADLLAGLRGNGDSPVIVTPSAVPGWEQRLGSLVQYRTNGGPVPLLVDDGRATDTAGPDTVVTLRQRLLSEASLASLQRAIDPESRADAVVLVDPDWDPGASWASGNLAAAFDSSFVSATRLDDVLTRPLSTYTGSVPQVATARPIGRAQLEEASDIVTQGSTLSSVISTSGTVSAELARDVAEIVAVRWRLDRSTGLAIATRRARATGAELDRISIEAPPSVTLSSSKGGFPLTIRNDTDEAIRIGVDLASSNPALAVPAVSTVAVGAGERRTLTVKIDLGSQRTTYLTARLTTDSGRAFGSPTTFKVRSSSISTVLWVAMGLAGAFVLVALVRRFHRRRRSRPSAGLVIGPADDDD